MVVGCGLLVIGWFVIYYPQPTTNNQQPTTDNRQPTTYHYTFIDILLLIGSILATYETSVT